MTTYELLTDEKLFVCPFSERGNKIRFPSFSDTKIECNNVCDSGTHIGDVPCYLIDTKNALKTWIQFMSKVKKELDKNKKD